LLDTERGELLAVRNGPAMLSAEQARELMKLCAVWQSLAPKCRKPVCGHAARWLALTLIANTTCEKKSTENKSVDA
jgi:hypothetical protein